jgi:hypothetical protein
MGTRWDRLPSVIAGYRVLGAVGSAKKRQAKAIRDGPDTWPAKRPPKLQIQED